MEQIETGKVLQVEDENGGKQDVEVLGTINITGTEYAAVSLVEDIQEVSNEDIDVFFLRVGRDGNLTSIESDEEFEKVSAAFDEVMADQED
ncbi:DUF1292 domain-containing protein [Peribacillus sp. B-H-3]|uniref:DUF1292 domain-containing protein n=1 Tax=Bacillaceae TaxID=186817 RepID=UPI0008F5B30F|nr:DUF1292 domain-containing protein [Bacillus sp. MUM 13]OIK12736.1 DUF1292 domain-containing protein [Bacillus sp. MUM 13]